MIRATLTIIAMGLLSAAACPAQVPDEPDHESMIKNAMSAAYAAISANATIMDWDSNVRREGSNGWTCLPDLPLSAANDRMCVDGPWLNFLKAFGEKAEPDFTQIGISYMLAGGGGNSNKDPFATMPTPDNEWMERGPAHVMLVVPNIEQVKHLSTDPHNGGPWLMWRGTPYAHVMIPVVPHTP